MQILSSSSDWNKQSNFLLIGCTSQTEGLRIFIWLFLQKTSAQPSSAKSTFHCYFAAFPVEANKSVTVWHFNTELWHNVWLTLLLRDKVTNRCYTIIQSLRWLSNLLRGWRNSPVLPNIRQRSWWVIILNIFIIVASLHFKSSFLS